jgi:hypothetical protein
MLEARRPQSIDEPPIDEQSIERNMRAKHGKNEYCIDPVRLFEIFVPERNWNFPCHLCK